MLWHEWTLAPEPDFRWFTGSHEGYFDIFKDLATQRLNNSTNKHSLPGHSGGIHAEKGRSGEGEKGERRAGV